MSSTITLLLLTTRLLVALPATAPPTRKNTSCTVVGLPAWLTVEVPGPTCSSAALLVVPASNSRPAILTPSTSATVIGVTPPVGCSVGKPMPSTTVLARVMLIVCSIE